MKREWWQLVYGEGIFESFSVLYGDQIAAQTECDRLVKDMEYDYAYAYPMDDASSACYVSA